MRVFNGLRSILTVWTLTALLVGGLFTWVWVWSDSSWQRHLDLAFLTGLALYETVLTGAPPPDGVTVDTLPANFHIDQVTDAYPPTSKTLYVATISLLTDPQRHLSGSRLTLSIVSPDLRYPVSRVTSGGISAPAIRLAEITKVMASYCSEPLLFARFGEGQWRRIDGRAVWGCAASPPDYRMLSVVGLVIFILVMISSNGEIFSHFASFSWKLKAHRRFGGPDLFEAQGPDELREIVESVNQYFAEERDMLEKRAAILSGVSHDLGTPATRLRLRMTMIDDDELRQKLEGDIDRMTSMIDSVLTYTRSEMSIEKAQKLSLRALVEAVVADYQDIGRQISMADDMNLVMASTATIFGGQGNERQMEDQRRLLVMARPISLQRAIGNLIDNALKYGRRAVVSLAADSQCATITIEDEGLGITEAEIEDLKAPFQRGVNASNIDGVGLGLTIVSTIAAQHDGSLDFERGTKGLKAILRISR